MESFIHDNIININDVAENVKYNEVTNSLPLYYKELWEIGEKPFSNSEYLICGGNNGNFIAVMKKPVLEREMHDIIFVFVVQVHNSPPV